MIATLMHPRLTTTRCVAMALVGALCGLAVQAYAQPTAPPVSMDTTPEDIYLLLETFRAVGLPGVFAWLAFQAGRVIDRMHITIRVHPEDLERLERALRREPPDPPESAA